MAQEKKYCYVSLCWSSPEACSCEPFNLVKTPEVTEFQKIELTLAKLMKMIRMPLIDKEQIEAISSLLDEFLEIASNIGYYVKHLLQIADILEFLAWKVRCVPEIQVYLDRMLDLCEKPPLLEKMSETITCEEKLEQYFTVLAYLLAIVPTYEEFMKIHKSIRCLLKRTGPVEKAAIEAKYCHRSMEKSRLPITLAELVEICSYEMYPKILELLEIAVSVSHTCCYRVLEAGILDHLLTRIYPGFKFGCKIIPPNDNLNLGLDKEDYYNKLILTTNILWSLMQSLLPPMKIPPDLTNLSPPVQSAMWSLRAAFKREVLRSPESAKSKKLRNELIVVILSGYIAIPKWRLLSSGLADDLTALAVATELGVQHTWVKNIRFGNTAEDLFFKKHLLLIMSHMARTEPVDGIMVDRQVVSAILQLVNPTIQDFSLPWTSVQFWHLFSYATSALTSISIKIPKEFIAQKGPCRLVMILEWIMTKNFDEYVMTEITRTVCILATSQHPLIVDNFQSIGMVSTLYKAVYWILTAELLTLKHQRILSYLILSLDSVMKGSVDLRADCHDENVKMTIVLLQRCLHENKMNSKLDQRFVVVISSYIWECIACCESAREIFLKNNGTFLIVDFMEQVSLPAKSVFLGTLVDMYSSLRNDENLLCIPKCHNETKYLFSLLTRIWREEEKAIEVRRTSEGCIEDIELPLMGSEQLRCTCFSRLSLKFSPSIDALIGMARPKIYCFRQILTKQLEQKEKKKGETRELLQELPIQDQITLTLIDHFFRLKQGEVWFEVSKVLEEIGLKPLGMDGDAMYVMVQRHRRWALFVKELQEKLLLAEKYKEQEEEEKEYCRLRKKTIEPTLAAMKKMDYILRTSSRSYLLDARRRQQERCGCDPECPRKEICDSFPTTVDKNRCNKVIKEEQIEIPVAQKTKGDTLAGLELPLISPISSGTSFHLPPSSKSSDFDMMCGKKKKRPPKKVTLPKTIPKPKTRCQL